jgi:hypothetical protein
MVQIIQIIYITSVNLVHNAPVELPPARSFLARGPPPPGPCPPPVLAPPAWSFPARASPGSPFPHPPKTLRMEHVVIGRIFQALPTQTDRRTYRHCNFNIYY